MEHLQHWWYIRPQKKNSQNIFLIAESMQTVLHSYDTIKLKHNQNGQIKTYPLEI